MIATKNKTRLAWLFDSGNYTHRRQAVGPHQSSRRIQHLININTAYWCRRMETTQEANLSAVFIAYTCQNFLIQQS